MPNTSPKKAGDNFYPKYNIVTTEPVSAIEVVKGRLYTKGSDAATANQLVAAGAAGFLNGIYQATASIKNAGTAGQHSVQCFGPGTRVGLIAKDANMHAGQKAKYDTATHKIILWTGTAGGITANEYNSKVGRIFKIYSKTDITKEKSVTAANDLVIVEMARD